MKRRAATSQKPTHKKTEKERKMILQVLAGEGGVNAVSCQRRQALVINQASSCSPVPLHNRKGHLQNALGGAILSEPGETCHTVREL